MDRTAQEQAADSEPVRLLIIIKRSQRNLYEEAWARPRCIITQVLQHLNYDTQSMSNEAYDGPDCRFMAMERWNRRIFIVCDLFNHHYDFLKAHLPGSNELPIRTVYLRDTGGVVDFRVGEFQSIHQVDEALRSLHENHGWEASPPFLVDHADGAYPVYWNPRSLKVLSTTD